MDPVDESLSRVSGESDPSARNYAVVIGMLVLYGGLVMLVVVMIAAKASDSLRLGPDSNIKIINLLEIVYFVASIGTTALAVIALLFARSQFRQLILQNKHAEHTSKGTVLTAISQRWDEEKVARARQDIFEVFDFYERNQLRIEMPIGEYFALVLSSSRDSDQDRLYAAYLTVASFIEDIGLFCHKNYVRPEDINDMIGAGIIFTMDIIINQVILEREKENDPAEARSLYAFALELYEQLNSFEPFEIGGYGAQRES